jgi:hypothetical protein
MADPTSVTFFGPLDAVVGPWMEYLLLVLAVATLLTRKVEHDAHQRQAEDGDDDALSRHPLHVFTLWGLVLASLYYTTLHLHAGVVLTTLVVGVFLADFFEFEARKVELREGHSLERPTSAVVLSLVALLYASYLSLFFLVEPYWSAIV